MKRATTLLIFLLLALPAVAETPDGTLRVFLSSANPTGDWRGDLDIGGPLVPTEIEGETSTGFGLVYEVRLAERWGAETGIYFTDYDFQIQAVGSSSELGSALAIPVTIGANFHPFTSDRLDVYVGPLLSYTLWGDLETPFGTVEVDADFGVGAVAGLDLTLGDSGWTLGLGARYLKTELSDPSLAVDVDPLHAEFGVGYRF